MIKHKTISIFNRIERERTYYLPHIKSTMFDYKQFGANTITGHKTKQKNDQESKITLKQQQWSIYYSNEAWKALCKP